MSRETGTVEFWNVSKGFGFIIPDNGGKKLFAHHKELERGSLRTMSMQQGQKVEYEVAQGPQGPAAIRIRII